jgi:hypothetical protein
MEETMADQTCAACGTVAPGHARFCPQCGTGFAAAPDPQEATLVDQPAWVPPAGEPWAQPAWPAAPAPAPARMSAGTGLPAVLALAGAVLVAAGVFLPWAETNGESFRGWSISDDAKVQLLIGIGCLLIGVVLVAGLGRVVCRLLLAAAGAAVASIAVVDMLSVQDENADVGAGLVVLVLAAAVFLLASALARPVRS